MSAGAIEGTDDDTLYETERNAGSDGAFEYNLPVTVGKSYKVTIKFAEIWSRVGVDRDRVFDVLVEGQTVANDLDVFALAGTRTAYDIAYTHVAADDSLDIRFENVVQKAKVSAVLVEEISSCDTSSPTESPVESFDDPEPTNHPTNQPTKVNHTV